MCHMCVSTQGDQKMVSGSCGFLQEFVINYPTWTLGSELLSSGRVGSAQHIRRQFNRDSPLTSIKWRFIGSCKASKEITQAKPAWHKGNKSDVSCQHESS